LRVIFADRRREEKARQQGESRERKIRFSAPGNLPAGNFPAGSMVARAHRNGINTANRIVLL
jgi:hypothetical protein